MALRITTAPIQRQHEIHCHIAALAEDFHALYAAALAEGKAPALRHHGRKSHSNGWRPGIDQVVALARQHQAYNGPDGITDNDRKRRSDQRAPWPFLGHKIKPGIEDYENRTHGQDRRTDLFPIGEIFRAAKHQQQDQAQRHHWQEKGSCQQRRRDQIVEVHQAEYGDVVDDKDLAPDEGDREYEKTRRDD